MQAGQQRVPADRARKLEDKGPSKRPTPPGYQHMALRAHLDQVPLNSPSETVVQPGSTAHFNYGFFTVEPLSWYRNKLLSRNLRTAIFQPSKRCHIPGKPGF